MGLRLGILLIVLQYRICVPVHDGVGSRYTCTSSEIICNNHPRNTVTRQSVILSCNTTQHRLTNVTVTCSGVSKRPASHGYNKLAQGCITEPSKRHTNRNAHNSTSRVLDVRHDCYGRGSCSVQPCDHRDDIVCSVQFECNGPLLIASHLKSAQITQTLLQTTVAAPRAVPASSTTQILASLVVLVPSSAPATSTLTNALQSADETDTKFLLVWILMAAMFIAFVLFVTCKCVRHRVTCRTFTCTQRTDDGQLERGLDDVTHHTHVALTSNSAYSHEYTYPTDVTDTPYCKYLQLDKKPPYENVRASRRYSYQALVGSNEQVSTCITPCVSSDNKVETETNMIKSSTLSSSWP